jgi:hypothetical protein
MFFFGSEIGVIKNRKRRKRNRILTLKNPRCHYPSMSSLVSAGDEAHAKLKLYMVVSSG